MPVEIKELVLRMTNENILWGTERYKASFCNVALNLTAGQSQGLLWIFGRTEKDKRR